VPPDSAECLDADEAPQSVERAFDDADVEDVERPSQIVDERREAELGAHIVEVLCSRFAPLEAVVHGSHAKLD
jgi:hypothetical protein